LSRSALVIMTVRAIFLARIEVLDAICVGPLCKKRHQLPVKGCCVVGGQDEVLFPPKPLTERVYVDAGVTWNVGHERGEVGAESAHLVVRRVEPQVDDLGAHRDARLVPLLALGEAEGLAGCTERS